MITAAPPPIIVVQPGDNLWKIAQTKAPNVVGEYWQGLVNANPLPDPNLIHVGQKLHAPTMADMARPVNLPDVVKVAVVQHAAAHPVERKVHVHAPVVQYPTVVKYVPKHSKVFKHSAAGVARTVAAASTSSQCGGDLPPCYVLQRESGGNPKAENPTSTASGLWQFVDGTWNNFGGYHHASDAPVSVQNARAREVWANGAGASAWAVH